VFDCLQKLIINIYTRKRYYRIKLDDANVVAQIVFVVQRVDDDVPPPQNVASFKWGGLAGIVHAQICNSFHIDSVIHKYL